VALGLAVSLGRWGGLAPLVEALPPLRAFRFPVKAFFTVHLAASLLAALGLHALAEGRRLRALVLAAGGLGAALAAMPLLPSAFPGPLARFAAAFFPPGTTPQGRAALLERVLGDAAAGGALALAVAATAFLAGRGRLEAPRAAWLAAALAAADLLRAGAGLNPMVSRGFYEPSPELAARLPLLRAGRVYTCPIETSPAYHAGRAARGQDHELWTFGLLLETVSPARNVPLRVPTALSPDLTMLVPTERLLTPEEGACARLDALLPRLREAGVASIVSLDPLEHPDLAPLFASAAERTRPVVVHGYALRTALGRFELAAPGSVGVQAETANRVDLVVETQGETTLVARDAWAPGWHATIDEASAPLERGRHRALRVPPGRHRIALRYAPPGLGLAALASAAALAVGAVLVRRGKAS
jgi:hypothetical protein